MIRSLLLALALAFPLVAQAPAAPALQAAAPTPVPVPVPVPVAGAKPRVQLLTSYGPVVVELEPELAPKTVANFLQYVQDGFYKGTIFHRVIEGFMVQGGGLLENLEEKPTRTPVLNEAPQTFKAGLKNIRGTLAMARTGSPHSAQAQFFISLADNPRLDHRDLTDDNYGYCVFGHVISGMETVDKIGKVRTEWRRGMGDVPQFAVRLKDAVLLAPQ